MIFNHPMDALHYHVSGAIARGEAQPIVEQPAQDWWSVVENAGYERERDMDRFDTRRQAEAWIKKHYDEDEIESLHVEVRLDRKDGTSEYVS